MREAFGRSLDQYVFHGGYPGAAPLIGESARWARYILDALVETTIARDVLLLSRVACQLFYWREGNREVDFVTRAGRTVTAIEVKSAQSRDALPGLTAFADAHRGARALLVGGDGIPIEEFLARPVEHWVKG